MTQQYNPMILLGDFWQNFVGSKMADARFRISGWTKVDREIDVVILEQGNNQSDLIKMVNANGENVLPASTRKLFDEGTFVYLRFMLGRPAFIASTLNDPVEFG